MGGLGDFSSALTRYLAQAGHDVRLIIPAYGSIDWSGRERGVVEFLRDVPIDMGGIRRSFTGLYSYLPGISVQVYFIDCPELYSDAAVYTDRPDELSRFALLSRAAIECCQRMGWAPDVFHCNDWHTALLPVYLRSDYRWDRMFDSCRSMLTIHNIGYQGVFPASSLAEIGLDSQAALFDPVDLETDRVNLLKTGILHTDQVTTVSPTHAKEIQTPEYGMGLDGWLRKRPDPPIGILNGVDYSEWDPELDPLLPYRFSARDLRGKAQNKRALLREMSLPFTPRTPLIGMVSRLVAQKGIDLMPESLPELLKSRHCRLAVLGSGDEPYERFFFDLQARYPEKVFFYRGYNNELSHRIEAASDLYLMPSLYEPCGLNQMYSLRYGAVPVVRRTGGLADAVQPFDPETRQGTGFLFEPYTPIALRGALERALDTYAHPRLWRRLVRNGMAQDFSWENQVQDYVDLYRELASRANRRGPAPPGSLRRGDRRRP